MDDTLRKASEKLSTEALENLKTWLTREDLLEFRPEIEKLVQSGSWEELEDSFYTHIRIGTGGIRGKIGPGPNRINLRTIGEAAQGLSQFIDDFGDEAKKKGVAVGYEARKFSKEFAQLSCQVFAANDIKSFIFDSLRATPEVSFAVRQLGAVAGVQITASHNPRTDNGFKFYWSDGGQVVPPVDQKFMELVINVKQIKVMSFEEAKENNLIKVIGQDVDRSYLDKIKGLSLISSRSAQITFSPIHGAGSTNVLPVLKEEGFSVDVVPEQAEPNENFPTAYGDFINPEYKEVMQMPIALAEKTNADIAICSDPDADRIGLASKVKTASNKVQFLTGNEVGVALTYFILGQLKEKNMLPQNGLVIKTYVTTTLISDVAKSFGVKAIDDLLVGFKFIGEIIEKLDDKDDFIFAAEESLGYLRGTFVRDKDAAIAGLLIAELASFLKDQNKTIVDYLDEIYEKYGYYRNILNMQEMIGKIGYQNIDKIMRYLRANPPKEMAALKVLKIIDRLDPELRKPENYKVGVTGDQVTLIFSDDERTRVTIRPSGTEPKIKYYIQNYGKVDGNLDEVKNTVDQVAGNLEKAVIELQERIIND